MTAKKKTGGKGKSMAMDKLYNYLPKSREGRTVVGLGLILFGLFTSATILTIVLIPLGIAVLAFDHEWARNILRRVRDFLNGARKSHEARPKGGREG